MHLFYIDDSSDHHFHTFSAIGIPSDNWRTVFEAIANFRAHLKETYGIYIRKELHAWKFVSGRGRPSDRFLSIELRATIFKEALSFLATMNEHGVIMFNVALRVHQDWAFERMLNRINRTMQRYGTQAMLICDEGKNDDYTKLVRKMGAYNPIPSKYGDWRDGKAHKNIPIDRIIEDPVFKPSHRSTLIQLADFSAYALLRREIPTEATRKYGLSSAFELLEPVCFKDANPRDALGIIR